VVVIDAELLSRSLRLPRMNDFDQTVRVNRDLCAPVQN